MQIHWFLVSSEKAIKMSQFFAGTSHQMHYDAGDIFGMLEATLNIVNIDEKQNKKKTII